MKADLTLPENQAAFDSQYYGQAVRYEDGEYKEVTTEFIKQVRYFNERTPLSLRHISSLTEEEIYWLVWHLLSDQSIEPIEKDELTIDITDNDGSVQVDFDLRCGSGTISFRIDDDLLRVKGWLEDETDLVLNHGAGNDFLRSISILIPWRGNSCDDLIASGVAVYREERKEGA